MIRQLRTWRYLLSCAGLVLAAVLWLAPDNAQAVTCGEYAHGVCHGPVSQYGGNFRPRTGYGGFGGGNCTATRTPVIFIHGNGDNATSWDAPPGKVAGFEAPPRSVYAEMKARGYNDCELFGVTYLTDSERELGNVGKNFHQPAKYKIIRDFIKAVHAYTGQPRVDIVAHSLGVTQTLATINYYKMDGSIRKFINIGGGLRGLYSCYLTGFASTVAPTCDSQNLVNRNVFGFFPEGFAGLVWVPNAWTGSGTPSSLRQAPKYHAKINFYTISAAYKDEVACSSSAFWANCNQTSKFDAARNVMAQIDVGAGKDAAQVDLKWDDYTPFNLMGGDSSQGVGHFRSKDNTGAIIQRMLQTDCLGLDCARDYSYGPKALY